MPFAVLDSNCRDSQVPKQVLLLDDDPAMLMILEFQLQKLGALVFTSSNVREAMSILDNQAIDLVIADYRLGSGNSEEIILETIRRNTRLCVLSSENTRFDYLTVASTNVSHLKKPVSLDTLMQILGGLNAS